MSTSSPMHLPRSRCGSWRCFTVAEIPDFWLPCFATEGSCDDACRKSAVKGAQMFESAVTSEGKMMARAALLPHSYPNVAGEPVTR